MTPSGEIGDRAGVGGPAPFGRPALSLVWTCLAVGALSTPFPTALGFDPWAWLVWGREVTALELDTTAEPSWKPLPVLVTTVASLTGDLAPTMWMAVGRTGGLLLVAGVFALAARTAGPRAGLVALAPLVLTPDGEPRLIRTIVEAHSAPIDAALAVWAVERHLAGRPGIVLALLTALGLSRPEAWPFLVAYGALVWWWHRPLRPAAVAALAVIPLLWFGGDWWGSGDPLSGAASARVGDDTAIERLAEALGTVGAIVVIPVWIAAAVGVAMALVDRDRVVLAVAALAAAWSAVVVGMATLLGYAALSRFLLPAAALACVLAGVGGIRAVERFGHRRWTMTAVVAAVLVVSAPQLSDRIRGLDDVASEIRARALLSEDLPDVLAAAGGPDAVLACGTVAVEGATLLLPAVAWELDEPISAMRTTPEDGPVVVFLINGAVQDLALLDSDAEVRTLAQSLVWSIHAVDCDTGSG